MRIGINIRPASWPNSGIARFVINIVEQLAEMDLDNEYFLYSNASLGSGHRLVRATAFRENFRFRTLATHLALYELVRLPRALNCDRVEAFFAPTPETLLPSGIPVVLTVHDLMTELGLPWLPLRLHLVRRLGIVRRAIQRCNAILCVSENTRNEVRRIYKADGKRMEVAYLGVDPGIARIDRELALKFVSTRFGIPDQFFFVMNPNRMGRFLEAFHTYCEQVGTPIPVVILGKPPTYRRDLKWLRDHLVADKVIWLDHASDGDLSALYSACQAFIYPSLYEGFGLPVLEAMHCRALCVVYSTSSLPEIVGDAGIVLSPDDTERMASVLAQIARDNSLRTELMPRIDRQAEMFNWRKTADTARKLLMECAPIT